MSSIIVFNSPFLARIVVYPYIYLTMNLKDLLWAALLDYLQKKFLQQFKYSKNQERRQEHMTREGNWNFLNLFLPLFLMLLKFNTAALLVPLLLMLHNPIIINLFETLLELDYALFSHVKAAVLSETGWQFRFSVKAGEFPSAGISVFQSFRGIQIHRSRSGWHSTFSTIFCLKHKVQALQALVDSFQLQKKKKKKISKNDWWGWAVKNSRIVKLAINSFLLNCS